MTATAEHPFLDVGADWQQIPVSWMPATGATAAVTARSFAPDAPASRAMVGTFLWRLAGAPEMTEQTHAFADVVVDWQQAAVEWMWRKSITTGRTTTVFDPDAAVSKRTARTKTEARAKLRQLQQDTTDGIAVDGSNVTVVGVFVPQRATANSFAGPGIETGCEGRTSAQLNRAGGSVEPVGAGNCVVAGHGAFRYPLMSLLQRDDLAI